MKPDAPVTATTPRSTLPGGIGPHVIQQAKLLVQDRPPVVEREERSDSCNHIGPPVPVPPTVPVPDECMALHQNRRITACQRHGGAVLGVAGGFAERRSERATLMLIDAGF